MQGSNLKYFFIGAFVVASGLSVLAAVNLTAFTPGTPIKSGDVNANFSTLKAAVEALQAGTGLADGAVTRAKLAVGGTAADGKVLKLQGGNLVWGDDLTGGGGGAAYSAGAGLSLSGTTFSVNFAGSGSAPTAAKSDHDHFGAAWTGAGNTGLTVGTTSTALGSFGLVGVSGGSDPGAGLSGGFRPRAGVLGVALPGPNGTAGVYGETKNGGAGVQGEADGLGTGVYGHNNSSGTYGRLGTSTAGVLAAGATGAPALEVQGAIKVAGTNKPVFIHTASSTCAVFGASDGTAIDNPFANGDPTAMLIVTTNGGTSGQRKSVSAYYEDGTLTACGAGRWVIVSNDATSVAGFKFNVMVVKQ